MTALVTGFEPFSGGTVNPSQLVVEAVAAREHPGVVTAVLPTSFRRAEEALRALVVAHRPATLLMLGFAAGTVELRFEQVALNLDDADAPDNDGEVRLRHPIVDDAPVAYRSTLDLDAMASAARAAGADVAFSHDAGGFVCNHVFFIAAHLAAVAAPRPAARCGFVHLGQLEAGGERIRRVVELVADWAADAA